MWFFIGGNIFHHPYNYYMVVYLVLYTFLYHKNQFISVLTSVYNIYTTFHNFRPCIGYLESLTLLISLIFSWYAFKFAFNSRSTYAHLNPNILDAYWSIHWRTCIHTYTFFSDAYIMILCTICTTLLISTLLIILQYIKDHELHHWNCLPIFILIAELAFIIVLFNLVLVFWSVLFHYLLVRLLSSMYSYPFAINKKVI